MRVLNLYSSNGMLISSRPGVPGLKSLNAIAMEHQGYAALLTENGSKISGFQWDISLYFNGKIVKKKKGIDAICITDEINKMIQQLYIEGKAMV